MRLVSFTTGGEGRVRPGVLRPDGRVADLSDRWPSVRAPLEQPDGLAAAARPAEAAPTHAASAVTLLPPVTDPGKILCVGINYGAHGAEAAREVPAHPSFFVRFPQSLVGDGDTILRPLESERLDWEGELAIVIGRRTRRAPDDATALAAVAGYSLFLDNAVRDWQRHSTQATAGKNFPRSGALGPSLVMPDEAGGPDDLPLRTVLNGEVMQEARTSDMIFGIAALIRYASTFCTLEPGDVIAAGTPSGVGSARTPQRWLRAGDALSVTVGDLGTLSVTVVDEVAA